MTWGRVEVTGGFFLVIALAVLMGAGEVLPLVGLAAVCHELGHLGALALAKVPLQHFRLSAFGAEIRADTRYLPYGKEILCVLAGPAVNLLLAVVLSRVSGDYVLAGANLLLGVFNLLPISGLDGGRVLHLLISWLTEPVTADRVCTWLGFVTALALTAVAAALVIYHRSGLFLLFGALGLLFPQLPLVKRRQTG